MTAYPVWPCPAAVRGVTTTNRTASCTAVFWTPDVDGILPKGPYPPCISPPCLRMADRALLAGYPRCIWSKQDMECGARRSKAAGCHIIAYLSRLHWIFPGAPLKVSGSLENIQGSLHSPVVGNGLEQEHVSQHVGKTQFVNCYKAKAKRCGATVQYKAAYAAWIRMVHWSTLLWSMFYVLLLTHMRQHMVFIKVL